MERKSTHPSTRHGLQSRSEFSSATMTSSDFVLQWGNRKRVRCMKVQPKNSPSVINNDPTSTVMLQRSTTRIDRRVVRSDLNNNNKSEDPNPNHKHKNNAAKSYGGGDNGDGYLNLRQRPASPPRRILRNTASLIGMKGHSNGVRGLVSPDRGDKKGTSTSSNININNHSQNCNGDHYNDHRHCSGWSGLPETAYDGKKDGCNEKAALWLPNFVITLTNKEKEEDFLAIKGCKLPQRPKKRARVIQRTLNLVSPGGWLCDLTLERYEVPEKKVPKKRPRGLKAMVGNVDSESE